MNSVDNIRRMIHTFGERIGEHNGYPVYSFVNRPCTETRMDLVRINKCNGGCPICGSPRTDERDTHNYSMASLNHGGRMYTAYECGMWASIVCDIWIVGAADPDACSMRFVSCIEHHDDII